ncbi:MAG: GH3 auxin-responsive promoter family protein [Myxococcales bacterium]
MRLFWDSVFYELVDLDAYQRRDLSKRKTLAEARAGERYALLVTTGNGGLSYVLGDVLECMALAPLRFRVAGRTRLSLNLVGEKVAIDEVESAVAAVSGELGASPGEFLVTARVAQARPRYLWVVENHPAWRAAGPDKLGELLDGSLRRFSHGYGFFREQLAPCEVVLVASDRFRQWLAGRTRDPCQLKVPRIVDSPEAVSELLEAAVDPERDETRAG